MKQTTYIARILAEYLNSEIKIQIQNSDFIQQSIINMYKYTKCRTYPNIQRTYHFLPYTFRNYKIFLNHDLFFKSHLFYLVSQVTQTTPLKQKSRHKDVDI